MSAGGEVRVHGVVWLLIRAGLVAMERCPRKAEVLGFPDGTWFLPGGKIEGDETPEQALARELSQEWPAVSLLGYAPMPIVEGSRVPAGASGTFLMRPYIVDVVGNPPAISGDGVLVDWRDVREALASPVPQVRMLVAGARWPTQMLRVHVP